MFEDVLSISSGTCENSDYESIDQEMCANLASSRNSDFRTVSNAKYAPGCVQVGDSVYYNNSPLTGGSSANEAVQQLCMLPRNSGERDVVNDDTNATNHSTDRMFDGTWLDKGILRGMADQLDGSRRREANAGYFPVNIRTIQQAVFYVNP